jgi:hypothetical protein
MRCVVAILFAGAFAAACSSTSEPEASSKAESRETRASTVVPAPSPSSGRSAGAARDPLEPVVVDRSPRGEEKYFYRSADGTTLAVLGSIGSHPHLWTRYRIYGPGWKPRTPLLQVPALLEVQGPVSGGFLGHVLVLDAYANTRVSKFVLVGPDGALRPVSVAREHEPLQPGDEVLWSMSGTQMAYRPSTGQAHRVRYADTGLPRYAFGGYDDKTGEGCALAEDRDGEQFVYWTNDSGHSWKHEKTSQMLGSTLGASMCEPAGPGRLVLVGANELEGVARASTVDLSPRKVSAYRLDKRFMVEDNQLFPIVLSDGRLAFHTLRRGLMVATDRSNSQFKFRPAPVDRRTLVEVAGQEMIQQNWGRRRNLLDVSTDAGRSWHTVDLQAGGWTRRQLIGR